MRRLTNFLKRKTTRRAKPAPAGSLTETTVELVPASANGDGHHATPAKEVA